MREGVSILLCVVLILSAGCLSGAPNGGSTTAPVQTTNATTEASTHMEQAGLIKSEPVQRVPRNASVINVTDDRIVDVKPLQRVVNKSAQNNTTVYERVAGSQFKSVNKSLHQLEPYANPDPKIEDGYYIRTNRTVVVVTLRVEQE